MTASSRKLNNAEAAVLPVDLATISKSVYARRCVGCLVLTQDKKILLQQRDLDCETFPGCLATFGGGIDNHETPIQALVRELREELGALVNPADVVSLGAITELDSQHNELIYIYFWHDQQGTITGCYEGKPNYYNDSVSPLRHPKIMNDVRYLLEECQRRALL